MNQIATTTLTAQDISSPLLVYTYTADADRELLVELLASGLAGGGGYLACLTKQIGGLGAVYQSPTALAYLAAGVTTVSLVTGSLPVESGDVVRVYIQGLAADTSVGVVVNVADASGALTLAAIQAAVAAIQAAVASARVTVAATAYAGRATHIIGTSTPILLTGLTIDAGWETIWLTAKRNRALEPDAQAVLQLVVSNPADADDGLTVFEGAEYTESTDGPSGWGLTVDQAGGSVTVTPGAAQSATFDRAYPMLTFDIKQVAAGGAETILGEGRLSVVWSDTRRV